MIQRPQSILLFFTAVMYLLLAFAPIWSLTIDPSTVNVNSTSTILFSKIGNETLINETSTNVYLLASCACGVILSIVSIFLFKNRPTQAKISALNSLIIMIYIGLAIFVTIPNAKEMIMNDAPGDFEWGFYLCVPIIVSNFIANKLIRKDEELVRSVDRIR